MKRQGWNVVFLAVSIRLWYLLRIDLKKYQSAAEWVFPEFFGVADSRSKSMQGRSKPGVGWGPTPGEFGECLSSKGERMVLYAINREPSDLGG